MTKPRVCVLQADGINCDNELYYAFEKNGASPQFVHINQLRSENKKLKNFQILAIPGGFSYGDDVASGKILAVELISFLKNQLQEFIDNKGLILGVCNGFQALVRTGLLPFNRLGKMDVTLAQNKSGHFECRWVKIKTEKSKCIFLKAGQIAEVAVNHGEGNFYAEPAILNEIENQELVVFRYISSTSHRTMKYPDNPNGSTNAIAGICDPSGRILGLMPHPEKFVDITQHPNWRRPGFQNLQAGFIIESMVKYAKS